MEEYYIGLMSGTSMDGVDAALVNLANDEVTLVATHCQPIPPAMFQSLTQLTKPQTNEIHLMAQMDRSIAELFAGACLTLLSHAKIEPSDIKAIGSHGQTIRHYPNPVQAYTLQLGDPNTIAALTGITTVADFRRRDLAMGGQGAPLVPGFHSTVFRHPTLNRVVVNIGGIANITYIPTNLSENIIGFDTGPGNTLINNWIVRYLGKPYDDHGAWAAQGCAHPQLLAQLLTDAYFELPLPKSTGREYFCLEWLTRHCDTVGQQISPVDIQATLTELTAITLVQAIERYCPNTQQILICGGGIHNRYLISRIAALCQTPSIHSTQEFGIPPDWVEAAAFAWMAKRTLNGLPSNVPTVTGARGPAILGGIYLRNLGYS